MEKKGRDFRAYYVALRGCPRSIQMLLAPKSPMLGDFICLISEQFPPSWGARGFLDILLGGASEVLIPDSFLKALPVWTSLYGHDSGTLSNLEKSASTLTVRTITTVQQEI
ncbi:hypothetical protein AWQ21_11945 [Picosynechococcus sp. PCC 7003]|nr:hypothetical protein AWQ21_11945 [Picosynechococcus sp. PCC 7003]